VEKGVEIYIQSTTRVANNASGYRSKITHSPNYGGLTFDDPKFIGVDPERLSKTAD